MVSRIGVFGDSFASTDISPIDFINDQDRKPWCVTLKEQLGLPLDIFALAGTSIWWSYQNFISNYKKYSHIVFIYSQHNRWHHVDKSLEGMNWITGNKEYYSCHFDNDYKKRTISLLGSCYNLVNDEKFDIFVQQQVFTEVNRICNEENIKLVNIFPFLYQIDLIMNNSNTIIYSLLDCYQEKINLSSDDKEIFDQMILTGDLRLCHLSSERNHLLARIIEENFDSRKILDFCKESENNLGKNGHASIKKIIDHYKNIIKLRL